jgi:hypothetical protein
MRLPPSSTSTGEVTAKIRRVPGCFLTPAVEDRHLGAVEVDEEVVEVAHAHCRQQVLDGRDRHVVTAKGGGQLDRADLARQGRDLDAAVGAPEQDPCPLGSGIEPHADGAAGMDSHPGDGDGTGDGLGGEQGV